MHCSGGLTAVATSEHAHLVTMRSRSGAHAAPPLGLYDSFDAVGLQYGPGYRTLLQAWGGGDSATARLRMRATHEGTQVHPADLGAR